MIQTMNIQPYDNFYKLLIIHGMQCLENWMTNGTFTTTTGVGYSMAKTTAGTVLLAGGLFKS